MSRSTVVASATMLAGLLLGACTPQEDSAPQNERQMMQVDHFIVAISDLLLGMQQIEELTGVRPVVGGKHPGAGTQNALIALGERQYLEILAPQTDVELPESVTWLLELTELTPMGFAVSTSDAALAVQQLQDNGYTTSTPNAGSRARPDGATLEWTSMNITEPTAVGMPFFIEWGADSPHPATTSPQGCLLQSLKVATPEHDELSRLFEVLELDVAVEGGTTPEATYEAVIECPNGNVVLK